MSRVALARLARRTGGVLLVAAGIVLLVTPGPGIPLILLGLRLLGGGGS